MLPIRYNNDKFKFRGSNDWSHGGINLAWLLIVIRSTNGRTKIQLMSNVEKYKGYFSRKKDGSKFHLRSELRKKEGKKYRCTFSYKIYIWLFDRIYIFWTFSLFEEKVSLQVSQRK